MYALPLKTDPEEEKILGIRLEAARQLYNTILGEVLENIRQMRQSKAYQLALNLPKGQSRTQAFGALWKKYQLSDYGMQAIAIKHKNACYIGKKLDTHVCQKIGKRVFEAVEPYLFGKRGRPRFKGRGRFRSVEGKSNASGIRWRDGKVFWNGLILKAYFDLKDKYGVESHALACLVKYLRLVKTIIRGKVRWSVQLILEGRPKIKHPISTQRVGLDVGPSSIAIYHPEKTTLQAFCASLMPKAQQLKDLQRKMARSRRLNNSQPPVLIGTQGKKHPLFKKSSKRYLRLKARHTEIYRRVACTRKKLHGTLVNEILSLGNQVYTEKLSYQAWQKCFGKSIGLRAPGKFISHLRDKAERAGGQLVEFGTFHTRLSQTCHCGQQKKKPLSQRWHSCDCGVGPVQRDLYSAYLAYHIEDNRLDTNQAQKAWSGAEALLERAVFKLNEIASSQPWLASFGLHQRQSGSHVKERSTGTDVSDVVRFSSLQAAVAES
jgi:transposase